ncbi:ExbD/TolR family protein [Limimonas halophila]|uniref:ExbD/TolR family protein n=1 Tax=Limimonas halophila TaxID=1082479 RepID=UPI000A7814BD
MSLTPLIDVVFILLVFFMLASSFQSWRSIAMEPPVERGGGGDGSPAVLVRLLPGGGLDLNGRRVDEATLRQRLTGYAERPEPPRVLIEPRPGVSLQRAVGVIDLVEAAGLKRTRLLRAEGGS